MSLVINVLNFFLWCVKFFIIFVYSLVLEQCFLLEVILQVSLKLSDFKYLCWKNYWCCDCCLEFCVVDLIEDVVDLLYGCGQYGNVIIFINI